MFKKTIFIVPLIVAVVLCTTGHVSAAAVPASKVLSKKVSHHTIVNFTPMIVAGKVASIDATTMTITAGSAENPKTYTVTMDGATITKNGDTADTSAIAVGDFVIARSATAITGTDVVATTVIDGVTHLSPEANMSHRMLPVIGIVASVDGDTFTVTPRTGKHPAPVTITTDAKTIFKMPGVTDTTISNVTVGENVLVIRSGITTRVLIIAPHVAKKVIKLPELPTVPVLSTVPSDPLPTVAPTTDAADTTLPVDSSASDAISAVATPVVDTTTTPADPAVAPAQTLNATPDASTNTDTDTDTNAPQQ